jgi:hypothetical protein
MKHVLRFSIACATLYTHSGAAQATPGLQGADVWVQITGPVHSSASAEALRSYGRHVQLRVRSELPSHALEGFPQGVNVHFTIGPSGNAEELRLDRGIGVQAAVLILRGIMKAAPFGEVPGVLGPCRCSWFVTASFELRTKAQVAEALNELLDDPDPRVRQLATESLGRVRSQ